MPDPDPRVEAYARLLLDWCIRPEPGWQVLISAPAEARPLAEALSRELGRRRAWPLHRVGYGSPSGIDAHWLAAAPAGIRTMPPLEQELVDRVDASIFVTAPERGAAWPAETLRSLRRLLLAYRVRGRSGEIPSVHCAFPSGELADRAGLSDEGFADLLYTACLRDWAGEAERMRPVLERLDGAAEVRIVGPGTDLTLSLEGRRGMLDDGRGNMPGGEAYWSPVEDSAEGVVRFDVPLATPEGALAGATLRLSGGEVVDADAESGEDVLHGLLAADAGARRFGELGVGLNDALTRPTSFVLFDEKLAGTVHLALGDGFPQLGGLNRSSIHADLIVDLRTDGRIERDGEVVFADGRWV